MGVSPIVWNNAELGYLAAEIPASIVLDDISRLGYDGCQFGRGFPEGEALRRELASRGLRLAELYVALPAGPRGLAPDALAMATAGLERLARAGGEVLVVALERSPERDPWSGRVALGASRWPSAAIAALGGLLARLAEDAASRGSRVAFHPHDGTWIEAPDEIEALADTLGGSGAGLCLDVGHYVVGGDDAVAAVKRFARRVTHVHLKDVDGAVLARMRAGEIGGFADAVRQRLFTELGGGVLDLDGVLRALAAHRYDGWLMVEQDSSWLAPAEAAAIGKRAVDSALLAVGDAAPSTRTA